MGKAGKWVMNFLLGKKQLGGGNGNNNNNNNNKVSSSSKADANGSSFQEDCSIETTAGNVLLPPQTPSHQHKRRWSFGKSSSKDRSSSSRSSSSSQRQQIMTTTTTFNPLLQPASVDAVEKLLLGPSLGNNEAVALAINEAIKNYERKLNPAQAAAEEAGKADWLRIVSGEHVAATRIQAAFRSYLARKALAALKGLVKLQALARGHLVRKHMSDTIRKMHAVMSIQVRARFQRMQMSEHKQVEEEGGGGNADQLSSKAGASPPQTTKKIKRAQSGDLGQKKNSNKDGSLNGSERITTRRHSGDLSFLKRERPCEDQSSYAYSYSSTQTSPATTSHRHSRVVSAGTSTTTTTQGSILEPSYMGTTQSSKAKSRSHSEPRQRPRRSISSSTRRSPSSDGTNSEIARLQFSASASQSKRVTAAELQDQWFIKLYRTTMAPPSQGGGPDYYCDGDREILVACEPHLNMY